MSFYNLPSSVIKHPKHTHVKAAYLFYYAPQDDASIPTLVKDALVFAKREGFDVFNCLNITKNELFLDDLHFGKGDGALNYYLYNYAMKTVEPHEVGLVML